MVEWWARANRCACSDVWLLHCGELVGVVETVTKKKITPYNLNKEFVKSVCSRLDKDAEAKRKCCARKKPHSTGTEFQEDYFH